MAENAPLAEVMRLLGVSRPTYPRWRGHYAAMRPNDVARSKNLEKESARLKRLVAEKEMDNGMPPCSPRENGDPNKKRVTVAHLVTEFGVSKPNVPGGESTPQHPASLHHPQ